MHDRPCKKKKNTCDETKIARLSTVSIVFRSIHSLDINIHVYIYIYSSRVCLFTYLYSPILPIISVFIAHHNTIRKISSPLTRNDNKNWTRLDFARISGNATRKMKNWREKIGGKFASRHLGSNSRRGVEKLGSVFSKGERKTFSRWLVEPWRESDAAFREGGRT